MMHLSLFVCQSSFEKHRLRIIHFSIQFFPRVFICLRCIICVCVKVAVSLSCQQVVRQYFILCNPRPSENQFTESCIKEKCFSQTNVWVNPVNHPDVHITVKQKHKYAFIAADICVQVLDSRFQFLLILSKYSWSN